MENNASPKHAPKHPQLRNQQSAPAKETAIARFAFTAQKEKDLSFNVGEIITIEKKRNNGWWIGHLSNGKRGYFPNNYVELIAGEPDPQYVDTLGEQLEDELRKPALQLAKRQSDEGGLIFNSSFSDI